MRKSGQSVRQNVLMIFSFRIRVWWKTPKRKISNSQNVEKKVGKRRKGKCRRLK